jgi:Domain of unknown function (DUF4190)
MTKYILILLAVLSLYSCSVQKRKYRQGFYISRIDKKQVNTKQTHSIKRHETVTEKQKVAVIDKASILEPKVIASVDAHIEPIKRHKLLAFKRQAPDSFDLIVLRNGEEVKAKVIEMTSDEVKYKKFNMLNGPLYVTKKSEIFIITYANGTRETFKLEPKTNIESNRGKSDSNNNNDGDKEENENALLALVFGIAGLVIGFGSIPAIILGRRALKEIRENPKKYSGEVMAKIGIGLGIAKLALLVLILFLIFAILLSF